MPQMLPACNATGGTLSPFSSSVSNPLNATSLITDWALPTAAQSIEWDLMIEREIPPRDPAEPATYGYYWQQQFTFDSGVTVQAGLQAEGAYYQMQGMVDKLTDLTKLAILWIAGVNNEVQLGELGGLEGRAGPVKDYMTIHVKYPWEVCHQYHFRFGPEMVDGQKWYGLSIEDRTAGTKLNLGRMRLPTDPGLLTPNVSSKTIPVLLQVARCSQVIPSVAIWGAPSVDGTEFAGRPLNRFFEVSCARSRATTFPGAVRHEAGTGM
jgi:hypothetical protein